MYRSDVAKTPEHLAAENKQRAAEQHKAILVDEPAAKGLDHGTRELLRDANEKIANLQK